MKITTLTPNELEIDKAPIRDGVFLHLTNKLTGESIAVVVDAETLINGINNRGVKKPDGDRAWQYYQLHKQGTGYYWDAKEKMMYCKTEELPITRCPELGIRDMDPRYELKEDQIIALKQVLEM